MKKLFLFAAAFAALTFASSCSKDDDNKNNSSSSTDTTSSQTGGQSQQPVLTIGEISLPKNNQVVEARSFTATWSESSFSSDGATIQYEAFLSEDGGSSWTSLGTTDQCSVDMSYLDSDKVYQFKVKTTCTDASGNVSEAETEPNSFVAYYMKGTIGASVTTANSVTMEWGNLLPYDTVELGIAFGPDFSLPSSDSSFFQEPFETHIITDGNSFTFQNLTENETYCIDYTIISKGTVMKGHYFVLTIDNSDKQFPVYGKDEVSNFPIHLVNGKQWIYVEVPSVYNAWFNSITGLTNYAYGLRVTTEQEWQELEQACGMPADELDKIAEDRGLDAGLSKKVSEILGIDLYDDCDRWDALSYDYLTNKTYLRFFYETGAISRREITMDIAKISFNWFIKEL